MAVSKIDMEVLYHQIARLLSYGWALTKPGSDKSIVFVTREDFNEEEQFIPEGQAVMISVQYISEYDISKRLEDE